MLGNSISYALKQEESIKVDKIKKLLSSKASEFLPSYYAVLYCGKSFLGNLLDPEEYRKRWDRGEVIRTHRFISKQINKCFGDIPMFWFINRHSELEDTTIDFKSGSFHPDLFIGDIPDEAIEDPSGALLPLFYKEDSSGIPINMRKVNTSALKLLLLDACIRQAKWIGNHTNSLLIQEIPPEEFEQTFHYGMKDITNLDDLNTVIDWKNSSFYNETTKEKIQ